MAHLGEAQIAWQDIKWTGQCNKCSEVFIATGKHYEDLDVIMLLN